MFYLTKEDWEMYILPKLNEARAFLNEFKYLKKIYSTMKFITIELKIYNPIVLSTSMIYFHQFCVLQDFNLSSIEKYNNRLYFISACLFIATKSTNHLVSINKIIKIIQQILKKKFPEKNIFEDEIKNNILNYELKILETLGFNLNIETPYKFYGVIKQYLMKKENKINCNITKLTDVLNFYINDTFILPLHLYFTPNVIAISCFLFLKKNFHLDSINLKEIMNLSEYLIDIKEVKECYNLFKKIYINESQIINSNSDSLSSLSTRFSKKED